MEITLEKIELVKDRTGVSYKEAKEALEAADGSVVDAIINIEEAADFEEASDLSSAQKVAEVIKSTIARGNMSRLIVKKNGETLLNLPLTAGVLGAVIAPWGVIVAIIAAAGTKCTIEFVNDKGETTDINGKVMDHYGKAKEKSQETIDKIKESELYSKGGDTIDRIKESELYADIKAKTEEGAANFNVKESLDELKKKGEESFEEIKNSINFDDIIKKGEEGIDGLKKKGEEFFNKKKEESEDPFLYEFEDDNVEMTFGDVDEADEADAVIIDNVVDAFNDAVADVTGNATTLEETVDALDAASDEVSTDEIDDLAKILDEVEKENGIKDITD